MYPLKLIIEDFLCYSKAEIDFSDFSSAVIIGKMNGNDKFSNGSGKTTIFSAIKYALFNKIDASSLDLVIRHEANLCKVIFDFKSGIDDNIYRIVRIKPRGVGTDVSLFILQNNKFETISARTASQTEREIANLIKINYETFCNSTLFAQSDLGGLAALTPGARKKALKEALQLNIYSKFEKTTAKKIADITKDIDKNKTIINVIENDKETIENLGNKWKYFSSEIQILFEKNKENINKQICCKTKLEELYEIKKKYADAAKKKLELEEDVNKRKLSNNDLMKKLFTIGNIINSIEKEITDINAYLNKYVKMDSSKLIKQGEELFSILLESKLKYKTLLLELDELNIPMPSDTTCKHCRQELSPEHRKICQNEIDKRKIQIVDDLKLLKNTTETKQKEYDANKQKILAIDVVNKELERKKIESIVKIKEVESKKSLFNELSSMLEKTKLELNSKYEELENINNISFSSKIEADIVDYERSMKEYINDIQVCSSKITELSNSIAVLESKKNDKQKDIQKILEYRETISKLEISYTLHQKVLQAFSHSGIPALITHTILDDFQIETNALLYQLRPGLQLEFSIIKDRDDGDKDDTLNIFYNLNGYQLEYALLSGAQKLIVSLCLKLGLAAVLKKRLGTDIKLFMIDEVDQSLDEGGLEAFENAIKKLQNDFKILIITHNKELKDKFNHAILVEQDQNFVSTAKVVSEW